MKIDAGPFLGSADAPLTLVEFSDYQCPFCKQFHTATFDQLRKEYIDKGKLRFISRDLPLEMHSSAGRAAQAARCAGDQGRFWQMRDLLIANAGNLGPGALLDYAHSLSLDAAKFSGCLESGQHKSEVQKDADLANSLGIIATPTFIFREDHRGRGRWDQVLRGIAIPRVRVQSQGIAGDEHSQPEFAGGPLVSQPRAALDPRSSSVV